MSWIHVCLTEEILNALVCIFTLQALTSLSACRHSWQQMDALNQSRHILRARAFRTPCSCRLFPGDATRAIENIDSWLDTENKVIEFIIRNWLYNWKFLDRSQSIPYKSIGVCLKPDSSNIHQFLLYLFSPSPRHTLSGFMSLYQLITSQVIE